MKPRLVGLVGSLLMMVLLPLLTIYFWISLALFGGAFFIPGSGFLSQIPAPTRTAVIVYAGWLLLQILLQIFAPGKICEGARLADGTRLKYKMNGWFSFWFSMAVAVIVAGLGWVSPAIFYDQFGPLLTTVTLLAFGLSFYLYAVGKDRTGNAARDYFTGTALNPRIGDFDLKLFFEARPGLILWVLVNLSFAAKQYQLHGVVTAPMILVNAFQFLYVADYFFHEEAILSTWDIKHENFGWMLCWGDLVWVPFMFSLQAHYLVDHTHQLSWPAIAGIVALNVCGYVIFRGANIQKHNFRKNPVAPVWGRPAEYITTQNGSLLLTSGWWGVARHMNYLGDLLMGLAWCLPAGFEHPLPYFYITYFTILLVHRDRRDHGACQAKYGADWDAYCRKVRWRIVPGLY